MKNDKWLKDVHETIYKKYKINIADLTTDFTQWGTEFDTLDLYAALHGEKLIKDPSLITKDMMVFEYGGKQYGIKTPISFKEARDSLTQPWKKEMFDQLKMYILDEEYDMLSFLGETFRATNLEGFDPVRLGFQGEIFFEKMLGNPNYFPRLWKTKDGKPMFGRRVAGVRPNFTKGRSRRPFISFLIPNAKENYEGMLPSSTDPSLMMASRKLYGAQWRELQVLMNSLNSRGLMKTFEELEDLYGVGNAKSINASWQIPEIGPAFEGMLVPSKANDVAFTPSYFVPREVAQYLENIYDAGRRNDAIEGLNDLNMLAKQVKVAFSPYQHIDMIMRSFNMLTSGSVFETFVSAGDIFTGRIPKIININNPKRIAQGLWGITGAPITLASDILFSNIPRVGKHWRNRLTKDLNSEKQVNALLKGNAGKVTFNMLVNQGVGMTGDRGITGMVRDSLQAYVDANPGLDKKALKEVGKINKFFQDGLFEGTYRYAQVYGIKYYVLPASQRLNPDFTPEQHAAWVSSYSNRGFSTLGLFQEWFKSQDAQKAFNFTIFSRIEGQALIEQFFEVIGKQLEDLPIPFTARKKDPLTGKRKGFSRARSQFWSQNLVSWQFTFFIIGSLIHAGAQTARYGKPKDFEDYKKNYMMGTDQMSPIKVEPDENSTFGYTPTYNSKYMSPIVGYFGRNDTPVYLDLVGQMDTAFRFLDPGQALISRLGVVPSTALRQYQGTTFFGQPFETKSMKYIQGAMDASAPWMANNALNYVANKYPKQTENYLPKSEQRLGTSGIIGQFFVNLRSTSQEGLKQYAIDQYKKEITDPEEMFLFPKKWEFLTPAQKDKIFNKFPNIKEEFNARDYEDNSYERLQSMAEIEKGVAYKEITARLTNNKIRDEIELIMEFVENRGRFGSLAYEENVYERGQDFDYKRLEMFREELDKIQTSSFENESFLKSVLAMKDYEPDEDKSNANTEALSQYYNEMNRFYTVPETEDTKKRGSFLIEEWVKYRDEEFLPSLNESQRAYIEASIGQEDTPYMKEYKEWENEAFEDQFMYEHYEYQEWWAEKINELKEYLDAIPDDRYLD